MTRYSLTLNNAYEQRSGSSRSVPVENPYAKINSRLTDILRRTVSELVLIELFSIGVTAELLRAKIDRKLVISLQRGH